MAVCARAEPVSSPRAVIEASLKTADCNQPLVQSLNNVTYHELGAGFSLAMVPCWSGPYQESHMMFLVAPKTGGMPKLLQFDEWTDKKFRPARVLWLAGYESDTRRLTSFMKFRGPGDCGAAGEWTWTGSEFRMAGYWYKRDCDGEEFDRGERHQVFPPRK
jgi:hypothetical protein